MKRGFGLILVACLTWCAGATADPVAPANTSAPTISGKAINGRTLTVSNGTWTGTDPITYTYEWLRCDMNCAPIAGATASSYTLTAADVNATVQALVIAMNDGGSTGAASNLVGPVGPSVSQIVAALTGVLSPRTTISALLRRGGYAFSFKAPAPGALSVTWTAGKQTIAAGHVNFTGTGRKTFTVRLTASGRGALAGAKAVRLTAQAKFDSSYGPAAGSRRTFTLGP